jgi:hypothetical protein
MLCCSYNSSEYNARRVQDKGTSLKDPERETNQVTTPLFNKKKKKKSVRVEHQALCNAA